MDKVGFLEEMMWAQHHFIERVFKKDANLFTEKDHPEKCFMGV